MLRNIPRNHPRAKSLRIRERLVDGFRNNIVVEEGLIAHGRGEAFDYLIRERTSKYALHAMRCAVAHMLLARRPVISVNGNVTCLCPKDIVELAEVTNAAIEVNLFYRTLGRELSIEKLLVANGAKKVLGIGSRASVTIPELMSERRRVDPDGIYAADVVLIPLEDGDRTEALVRMGKRVIAVDLNPLSRTAQKANVTIVDNVVRTMARMVRLARQMKRMKRKELRKIAYEFDNKKNLDSSLKLILSGLKLNGAYGKDHC
ncbi:MAG: 4-phosphopantoate--beta-alanine ligase [Nitrososphaerales archaeon]